MRVCCRHLKLSSRTYFAANLSLYYNICHIFMLSWLFFDIQVLFLSVALHQQQLSNCLFTRIWRNVYLYNRVMDESIRNSVLNEPCLLNIMMLVRIEGMKLSSTAQHKQYICSFIHRAPYPSYSFEMPHN